MIYADIEYYKDIYKGTTIPDNELEKKLKAASKAIDTLTYNRIVGKGFSNLTGFQKETILESCCELADFQYENADIIESILNNYSINGVSMRFGNSWNVMLQNGIAIKRSTFEELCKTGLCCRALGR